MIWVFFVRRMSLESMRRPPRVRNDLEPVLQEEQERKWKYLQMERKSYLVGMRGIEVRNEEEEEKKRTDRDCVRCYGNLTPFHELD